VNPNDLTTLAKNLADMIVYVWLFSLAISVLLGKSLNQLGFTFRTLPGFWSPPVAASIHQTARFPIANSETFLLLGGMLLLRGSRDFVLVILIALLLDCLGHLLWSQPRRRQMFTNSNILFTVLGFLLLRGYFEAGILAVLVTILVGCLCSKMLWGMVPISQDIVWKAHLVSFIGGAIAARYLDAIAGFFPVSQLW
jgi:hypothetical protein